MPVREVAVLGCGNGALTTAGDLALAGYKVRMWTEFPEAYGTLYETPVLRLKGLGRTGEAHIAKVTRNLEEAVSGADVICSPSPAFTQERVANRLAPYVEDSQVIFLSPGSMGGYIFANIFREQGVDRDVAFAEPGTLPYLCRKTSFDEILVSGQAVRLPVGVFPSGKSDSAIKKLQELYPAIHEVENTLSVALLNVGPIIHSCLVLLNTGPIEHFKAWDIHNEGTTPAVKKLVLAHDSERIGVRRALGLTSHHYPFADHYNPHSQESWMYGRKAHSDLVQSESWREPLDFSHRYIREDVKHNLALFTSIGNFADKPTPIADSLLTLLGVIAGEDFRRTGRTLKTMGLGGVSLQEMERILFEGL